MAARHSAPPSPVQSPAAPRDDGAGSALGFLRPASTPRACRLARNLTSLIDLSSVVCTA
jgi:hypothetical protein